MDRSNRLVLLDQWLGDMRCEKTTRLAYESDNIVAGTSNR
jgi:hypothetical protein